MIEREMGIRGWRSETGDRLQLLQLMLNFWHDSKFIVFFLSCFFLLSCSKIYVSKLQYDNANGFYRYPVNGWMAPVRNDTGALVTRDNLKDFLLLLDAHNNRYFKERIVEPDIFISPNDDELVDLYSGIITSISQENKDGAKYFISEFEKKLRDAEKFSDIDYLKGRTWEIAQNVDSARHYYKRFLNYSGSKYSRFFRGYTIDQTTDECFTTERNYAQLYCSGSIAIQPICCTDIIKPKYYYQSFSQGYVFNREDFGPNNNYFPGLNFGYDKTNGNYFGIGMSRVMSENWLMHLALTTSDHNNNLLLAVPVQIYKSSNNSFGIKFSFLGNFQNINNRDTIVTVHNNAKPDTAFTNTKNFYNLGGSLSAGYHFTHHFYVGASYQYFIFNQNNFNTFNFHTNRPAQKVYLNNEYDVSLYWQLIKGFSIKAGVMNNYPSLGLNILDMFVGYNFKDKAFVIRYTAF